jgi:YHS domain-containing protein
MIVIAIRLLFLWFVVRGVIRLVRGIAEGMQAPPSSAPPAVPLARDPVCGTFVVPATALTLGSGSQMRFFCSEDCRRAYLMKITR